MRESKFFDNIAFLFIFSTILAIVWNTSSAAEDSSYPLEEWQVAKQDWGKVSPLLGDVKVPTTIQYQMNIKVYSDPDIDYSSYRTYSIDYTNKENRLLEKGLFKILESAISYRMGTRELVRSDEDPDILITMDFYTGRKEEYVPPATVVTTRVEQVWSSSLFGWSGYTPVPITESQTTQGQTNVWYYRNIRLNFLDFKKLSSEEELDVPPLIWIGEVESEGSSSDIRDIAFVVLNQLLSEFPEPSGRKMTNRIQFKTTYGHIGISVDSKDRRKIVGVAPDSPAERAGVKAGDKLLTVNKKKISKGPPKYITDIIAAPYFKYVISNPGNNNVSLLIKSAERKKKYKVEILPIVTWQEWKYTE